MLLLQRTADDDDDDDRIRYRRVATQLQKTEKSGASETPRTDTERHAIDGRGSQRYIMRACTRSRSGVNSFTFARFLTARGALRSSVAVGRSIGRTDGLSLLSLLVAERNMYRE